ncbi:MAG: aryl-sulfate sulfotransferase, partial [Ekhidna sp.]|nr:aryl-sulfate sulfotransferase [Ekhidna sp.]
MKFYLKIILNFLVSIAIFSCSKDEGETPSPSTESIPLPQGQSDLRVKEVFTDSMIVQWDSVENAQTYELSLNDDILSTTESLIYTVKDLSPATAYTIGLMPLNSEGGKGKQENISATTLKKEVRIEESTVLLNPFITAPLAALVRIGGEDLSPEAVETIKVKVAGKSNEDVTINGTMYPQTDEFKTHFFDITADKKFNQTIISDKDSIEIPVLGLYADYNNTVEYEVETNTHIYKGTASIETDPIGKFYDHRLTIEVKTAKPDKMEPGEVTWNSGLGHFHHFMFDHRGELRLVIKKGRSDLRILRNGNLLIRPLYGINFNEYSLLGEELRVWNVPSGFRHHHDIYEMPSGNFLVAVDRQAPRKEGYNTVEDCVLELDRETGQIRNYWDLFELMDIKNLKAVWQERNRPYDWFHLNSFWYDEIKDEIIVSGRYGGMLKLSRNGENGKKVNTNKEIIWFMPRFGQYEAHKDHSATKDYILTAVNASGDAYSDQSIHHEDFHWPDQQHNPSIIPSDDGLLHFLIFNNFYDDDRSAIVEYAVDEAANTVKQVWQYGKHRPELHSHSRSGATWLPITNNRMMITQRSTSPSVEVTVAGEVVFEY